MRLTGIILALCIGLAALKAAATVIGLLVIGGLVASAISRPADTLGFLAGCTLLSILGAHPLAGAIIVLSLGLISTQR